MFAYSTKDWVGGVSKDLLGEKRELELCSVN